MSDEAAAFLAELREWRSENESQLNAMRDQFAEGIRQMDRGFADMHSNLDIITTQLEQMAVAAGIVVRRLGRGDPGLPSRRTLG